MKRSAFMRSFDSAIDSLLQASRYLDELPAQRQLYDLSRRLREFEHKQLERSDLENDFSRIRQLRESRRQRRRRRREGS